jgi:NAD(P)H-dependent flavin oxidoreductase YrpB (nitropropane dioxygenase family)
MPEQALLTTPMALGAASVGRHLESGIFCGQGVARIASVLPAHEIVTRMIDQARDILQRELPARVSFN